MKVFIATSTFLALVLCYSVGRFITSSFELSVFWSRLFWVFHLFATLTMIVAPFVYRLYPMKNPHFLYNALHWAGYFFMGFYSVLIIFVLISDISLGLYLKFNQPSLETIRLLKYSVASISLIVSSYVAIIGLYEARKKPAVTKIQVPISDLPSEFEGFKIVQLSDIHVGETIKASFVESIVEIANSQSPDIIVLTGDLVDGTVEQLSDEMGPFKRLRSKHGTLMAPGNHEYYWNVNDWIQFWKSIGVTTLVNQHISIQKNSKHLIFAGVHDYSASRINPSFQSSPTEALHGSHEPAVKILLAHQPRSIYAASKAGVDLQLSGHTHSGQYFPYNLLVYFFQPFVKGLDRFGKTWIYVNQGTGYWGPPTRLGAPSEITLITLQKADGA